MQEESGKNCTNLVRKEYFQCSTGENQNHDAY